MTAVLLAWDPAHWDEWQPSYPEAIIQLGSMGVFRHRWSVASRAHIAAGTEAWLFLQGTIPGLIGHGIITSAPHREATHSGPSNTQTSGARKTALFVNVDFDALLPIGDQIPAATLSEGTGNPDWAKSPESGQRIPSRDEPMIRALWAEQMPMDENDPILPSPGALPADAVVRVAMNRFERDAHARRLCLAHYGTSCAACGFSFEATYGPAGEGFIHVHHLVPISQLNPEYQLDPIQDLIPLCPNCHYMAHRRPVPYTPSELRLMVRQGGHIGGTVLTDGQLANEEDAKRILGS